MKKKIHQIFLDVGLGKLKDNKLYMTKCKNWIITL